MDKGEEKQTYEFENVQNYYKEVDAALDNSFDGVMITSNKGIGMRVNPSILRLTALEKEHFIGKNIEHLTEKGIFAYEPITIKALQEKRIVTGVQEINTGRAVTVTGVPVTDDYGRIIRVITNVRDLAELNKLKEDMRWSEELLKRYESELATLRFELIKSQQIIAQSEEMLSILETAFHVANSDVNVLILGESGVGKDIIARVIHDNSSRQQKGSFIKVNCGAVPGELMESEFFGYERGSFTGAKKEGKKGYFELAHGGTLFLDEIADLPLDLQVKLLRAIEDSEFFRVGGETPVKADVRIVAATNKDIEALVKEGKFREDLYYRLNVVPITVPPLRERPEDVSAMLGHFLNKYNEKYKVYKSFSNDALQLLMEYSWPGNARELINLVERLIITTRDKVILPEHLPKSLMVKNNDGSWGNSVLLESDYLKKQLRTKGMKQIMDETERKILLAAFEEHKSSRKVGEVLGVSHATVINKLKKHGII